MNLVNNYLHAVGKHLPERQRDDIVRELSANLAAEIDDVQASLGRPTTEDEVAAVLRRHGHPMIAAARYAPQAYLIGPALFPIYRYVLSRALPIAALAYAIASATAVAAGAMRFGDAAGRVPGVLFGVVAWVTLVFAAGEWGVRKYGWDFGKLRDWNPRDLPNAGEARPEPLFKSVCRLAAGLLFTAWVAAVPYYPFLLLGPAAAYLAALPIAPAPFWGMLYWPVIVFFLARTAVDFASATLPSWRARRDWAEAVLHGIAAVGLMLVVQAGPYFSLLSGRGDSDKYQSTVAALNQAVLIVAAIALVTAIAQTALAARRVIGNMRGRRVVVRGISI